jgi:hypothetical protein
MPCTQRAEVGDERLPIGEPRSSPNNFLALPALPSAKAGKTETIPARGEGRPRVGTPRLPLRRRVSKEECCE